MDTTRLLDAALRKAGAVWIRPQGHSARLVWTVWREQSLWVATGPDEQEVAGLSDGVACTVTLRSPSTHSHLADVPGTAHLAEPDAATSAALEAARLNAPPRWSAVYRIDPR